MLNAKSNVKKVTGSATDNRFASGFREWSSLFSGELFVKLVAYLDESGRHDRAGKQKGSEQIVVAGWLDWRENWEAFCQEWSAVLHKYRAPYFHFAEWADASAVVRNLHKPGSTFGKNPYQNWELRKLDTFLDTLSDIAGSGQRILLGGFMSTRDYHEAKRHPAYRALCPQADPYRECLMRFFEKFSAEVESQWPYWEERVSFFFDQNDDPKWNHAVQDAHTLAQKRDARIGELTFADKRLMPHLPLQAADMAAYHLRQITGKVVDPRKDIRASELTNRLFKKALFRSIEADPYGSLMDAFSLLPLRFSKYPWREARA